METTAEIKAGGKSWVLDLPSDFLKETNMAEGTKVILTYNDKNIDAEILSPLTPEKEEIASRILEKRRGLYEELKRVGD
jgi:antitoxin component of MazEF toxin-antitoxin module